MWAWDTGADVHHGEVSPVKRQARGGQKQRDRKAEERHQQKQGPVKITGDTLILLKIWIKFMCLISNKTMVCYSLSFLQIEWCKHSGTSAWNRSDAESSEWFKWEFGIQVKMIYFINCMLWLL